MCCLAHHHTSVGISFPVFGAPRRKKFFFLNRGGYYFSSRILLLFETFIMTDHHCEEQEMEAEALTAIFDDQLEIIEGKQQPFQWAITIWPEQHQEGDDSLVNHVGIKLMATLPLEYPEVVPTLDIEILRGLTDDHRSELLQMAQQEAEANVGLASIFAICEKLREWLADNNQKGMDDVSMYAQMMRKQKDQEKQEVRKIFIPSRIGFVCLFVCLFGSWDIVHLQQRTG